MNSVLLVLAFALVALSDNGYDPNEKRLIQYGPGENMKGWFTVADLEVMDNSRHFFNKLGVGYFDITDFQTPLENVKPAQKYDFPTSPSQQAIVNPLLQQASGTNLRNYITSLSGFTTRYYTTSTGAQSAIWLRDIMQSYITASGRTDCNCTLFAHSGYVQNSVICTIIGTSLADEVIITGAHLDSINSRSVPNGVAPGADDDASGVASFVEAFRIFVSSGFRPLRTLEFMAYAAEEVGLRGSQDIARSYLAQGKNVYAVYQNEMSGYAGSNPAVTILQDFVDPNLTRFVESLVNEYLEIPFVRAVCGYGCSDHASFTNIGYSAVCTAEAGPFGDVNPNMHTDNDLIASMDMDFTLEFAKLALAFLAELSLVA
jgi:leucyl aminopeptidase